MVLALFGCKPKTEETETMAEPKKEAVGTTAEPNCTILDDVEGTAEQQAEILLADPEKYCDHELRACIEDRHNVGFDRYDDAIKLYRKTYPTAKPDYYAVKWAEFDSEIEKFEARISYNCYADYLSFELNTDGTYKYKFTNHYSSTISSYSIPLLRGIEDKFKLVPDDWFVFSKGRIIVAVAEDGTVTYKDIILFTVKGNYYDISDDPKLAITDAISPSPL